MLLRRATFKSMLISLGAVGLSAAALWFVPAARGTEAGDFFGGLRLGLTFGVGGWAVALVVYRLVKGRWPAGKSDERDALIDAKSGAYAFYFIGVLGMAAAVAVPLLWPGLAVRLDRLTTFGFIGLGLVYAACRLIAEARN